MGIQGESGLQCMRNGERRVGCRSTRCTMTPKRLTRSHPNSFRSRMVRSATGKGDRSVRVPEVHLDTPPIWTVLCRAGSRAKIIAAIRVSLSAVVHTCWGKTREIRLVCPLGAFSVLGLLHYWTAWIEREVPQTDSNLRITWQHGGPVDLPSVL